VQTSERRKRNATKRNKANQLPWTASSKLATIFSEHGQRQMFILLMFFTNIPPMIVGEFASRAECEQVRLEIFAGETTGLANAICYGPEDRK
jgi:hypothetical protein